MLVLRVGNAPFCRGGNQAVPASQHGIRSEQAASGREALEFLRLYDYDLVLMDLHLSGRSRLRGRPHDARRVAADAGGDHVGYRDGAGQGEGARPGRRRFPDHAVRLRRGAGAHPRRRATQPGAQPIRR